MGVKKRSRSGRSVDHLTDSWLADFESELRALLPVDGVLSTNSSRGLPPRLPPGLLLEMLTLRVFRVSLSTGVSFEHVDMHLDRTLRPVRATYRFEGLTGDCELNVGVETSLFDFVADCYRRFSI